MIDIVPFFEIVEAYPSSRNELLSLSLDEMKPLSVFIPKGRSIQDYGSAREFFEVSGSSIEFFNKERPVIVSCSKIEI